MKNKKQKISHSVIALLVIGLALFGFTYFLIIQPSQNKIQSSESRSDYLTDLRGGSSSDEKFAKRNLEKKQRDLERARSEFNEAEGRLAVRDAERKLEAAEDAVKSAEAHYNKVVKENE
ncbi:MAG: hypothetical protein ACQKBY_09785 [Verrucomicrobiales bacterium]